MKIQAKELLNKLSYLISIVNDNDFSDLATKFYFEKNKIFTYDGKMIIFVEFENDLGDFSVSQNEFYKTIQKLEKLEIELNKEKDKLVLIAKRTKIEFMIEGMKDISNIKIPKKIEYKNLPEDFEKAINLTKFCIKKDNLNQSSYLSFISSVIYATDKYRICRYEFKNKIEDMFLPFYSLELLLKSKVNQYSILENILLFKGKDVLIGILKNDIAKLDFNQYNPIFESKGEITIDLPENIKQNIEISEIFTDKDVLSSKEIEFIFSKNQITCRAKNQKGIIETKIRYRHDLELSFFIHPLFLLEVLKICNQMEIIDDIVLFRSENFCYFFRIRK